MAIDRSNIDERQARIEVMLEEFRAAQQRQLVKRGIAMWERAEAAQRRATWSEPRPPVTLH